MDTRIRFAGAVLLLSGVVGGCASVEHTVRDWTGTDQGLAELDSNGDGVISRDEASGHEALAASFDEVDTNSDSNINPAELQAANTRVAELDFAGTDFNGDGVISAREADAVRPSLSEVFGQVDTDGDGNVSEKEYQAARLNLLEQTEFAAFDTDGDGILDRKEAGEQRYLSDNFSRVDIDGDDLINKEEFEAAQKR